MKGGEPESTTPEQHAAIIDREETKWSTVIMAPASRLASENGNDGKAAASLKRRYP
jgi:hypothetical protein